MTGKTPLDDLFEQFAELLRVVEENSTKIIDTERISPELDAQLAKLEKKVEEFKKLGNNAVSVSGVSNLQMEKQMGGEVDDLPPEGQDLISKAKKLRKKAETIEKSYRTGEVEAPEPTKLKEDPEYGKHRRKKFKRFGSDDKWKPL